MRLSIQTEKIGLLSALILTCAAFSPITTVQPALSRPAATSPEEKPIVYEETKNGKTFVVTKVLVKAHIDRVWPILADYNNAPRTFSLLKKCELLEDKGSKKIVKHELAPSGLPDTYEYIVEIQECPPKTMEWHRISGDFKEVDGFWKLEPTDMGRCTMVTYASHVNGGFFMPQMLIKRQLRADMPVALAALKTKAEGPTQIASRHQIDRTQ